MKDTTPQPAPTTPEPQKNGLFRRMFLRLDESMKQKADQKTKEGGCCGTDKKGGGKCC